MRKGQLSVLAIAAASWLALAVTGGNAAFYVQDLMAGLAL